MMSDCLDDSLAVLRAAALLSGDLNKANTWSFAERIGLFDELTAEELVQQGRGHDVLHFIEQLDAGFAD